MYWNVDNVLKIQSQNNATSTTQTSYVLSLVFTKILLSHGNQIWYFLLYAPQEFTQNKTIHFIHFVNKKTSRNENCRIKATYRWWKKRLITRILIMNLAMIINLIQINLQMYIFVIRLLHFQFMEIIPDLIAQHIIHFIKIKIHLTL